MIFLWGQDTFCKVKRMDSVSSILSSPLNERPFIFISLLSLLTIKIILCGGRFCQMHRVVYLPPQSTHTEFHHFKKCLHAAC